MLILHSAVVRHSPKRFAPGFLLRAQSDAIAHGGTPWVNLRAKTVRTIVAKEEAIVLSRAQALALEVLVA